MKTKLFLTIVLLLLVVLFTLQNTEMVTINLFLWQFSLSRALMIFLILSLGILIGFVLGSYRRHVKDKAHHRAVSQPGRPADAFPGEQNSHSEEQSHDQSKP